MERRYTRGYLPHIDAEGVPQFVTFRLADSIPNEVLLAWDDEIDGLPKNERRRALYQRLERHLHAGAGGCILARPEAARIVVENIKFGTKDRYLLHAYCVMPNHVHLMISMKPQQPMATAIQQLKSHSSREIHRLLGGEGALWQRDYFDRMIRSEKHFELTKKYIEWNPVKAKLCTHPKEFPWSSAGRDMEGFEVGIDEQTVIDRPGDHRSPRQTCRAPLGAPIVRM